MSNILRSVNVGKHTQKLSLKRGEVNVGGLENLSATKAHDAISDINYADGIAATAATRTLNGSDEYEASHQPVEAFLASETTTAEMVAEDIVEFTQQKFSSERNLSDQNSPSQPKSTSPSSEPDGYAAGFKKGHQEGFVEGSEKGNAEGYKKGQELGYSDGQNVAAESLAKSIEHLNQLVTAVKRQSDTIFLKNEERMVAIAFAAVAKILGKQSMNIDAVKAMVSDVASDYSEQKGLVVKVSSQDYALLKEHKFELDNATLKADEKIRLGGCIVETNAGVVDARFDTQLDSLKKLLVTENTTNKKYDSDL